MVLAVFWKRRDQQMGRRMQIGAKPRLDLASEMPKRFSRAGMISALVGAKFGIPRFKPEITSMNAMDEV